MPTRLALSLALLLAAGTAHAGEPAASTPVDFSPLGGLERAEGATALAADRARGRLAVGDARGVWLREPDGRVRRALEHIRPGDAILAPDCGMKYLPRAVADGKMRAMVAAAQILRREHGQ